MLSYSDMTGYDLSKNFNQSVNFFWNAQQSQIYRDLGNLEKKSFVESKLVHQEGKPDKKVYSITEKGKKELINWINQYPIEEGMKFRDSFLMRIFFSGKGDNKKLKEALIEYIKQNKVFVNSLKAIEEEVINTESLNSNNEELYWFITIKKGYYDFKANIEWANEVLEMLNNL